jgi:hypothetical protein
MKHMYGTQAAADGWQQEYSSTLIDKPPGRRQSLHLLAQRTGLGLQRERR